MAEISVPACLRVTAEGVNLAVKVQPRASANELVGTQGDVLRIKIAAPPVDSAANEELVRFLAECLDCPRRSVELVRGGTSRHKVLKITGVPVASVMERLRLQ